MTITTILPRPLRTALYGAGLALATLSAQAAPLWEEAFDGDLSNDPSAPTDLGTLTAEFNELTGSLFTDGAGDGSGTDPRDAFAFTALGAWALDIDFLDLGGPASLLVDDGATTLAFTSPTFDAFTGGAGTWAFSLAPGGSDPGTVDYALTLFLFDPPTADVPEPLAASLFGLGLLGLARRRRAT